MDSINIELADTKQGISRLSKDNQEIENQLNAYTIFGLKIVRNGLPNLNQLQQQLTYQKNLLHLEKIRANYLTKLQSIANTTWQIYKIQSAHVDLLLKSRTTMELKEQQVKSELGLEHLRNI